MLQTDSGMPEAQSSATLSKGKPDEVMLKDVVNPSILTIALVASVLLILFCWYFFVLEPALSVGNPMNIKVTKLPNFNSPVSQELNTGAETQKTDDDLEPLKEAFENKEKYETVPLNKPTRRIKSTKKNPPIKSATSNIALGEKEPTAQNQDSPRFQNEEEKDIRAENIRDREDEDEDTAEKIKSFAVKWKESFLTPATQSICTQVQIAINQCPN